MTSLRDKLRDYAKEHGLAVSAMEKIAGLPQATIAKLNGISSMSTRNFAKILEAFPDMDAYDILGVERGDTPAKPKVSEDWYLDQIAKKDAIIDSLLKLVNK